MSGLFNWLILGLLGAVGGLLYKAYKMAVVQLKRTFMVQIEVEDAEAFRWVAEWLAIEADRKKCQKLTVHEHSALRPGEEHDPLASKAMFIPGEGVHVFWINGRRVWIERTKGAKPEGIGTMPGVSNLDPDTLCLTTIGRDPWLLKKVVLDAELAFRERRNHALSVFSGDKWGDWNESAVTSGRSMETVVLPDGVSEEILLDVREFLGAQERYTSVGIPYRRGYLLYGEPGCGKSSLAKAIASECGLNLYVMSLSNGISDDQLHCALDNVKPHSLVLLEDIDSAISKGKKDGVTRSGLLNALDGVNAAEGRVLVMTTNHKEKLDPALTRAGRVDVAVELTAADESQARRLFERFFPDSDLADRFAKLAVGATPATIQGHLIANWDDPAQAVQNWACAAQ